VQIHVRALDLPLHRPFTISRGSRRIARNILVEVEHEGRWGRGEGAPNPRYAQSQESAVAAVEDFVPLAAWTPFHLEEVLQAFSEHAPGESAARCALESALWDWVGRARRLPLCRMLAIDPTGPPPSSYTLSIDQPEGLRARIREAKDWPILKLKLGGGPGDFRAVEELGRWTDRPFRVDANEAWSEEEAAERIAWLAQRGCELVEQPLPAGQWDAVARIREHSPLPLVADEDVTDRGGVKELAGVYDGINVKLMKAGGITEAVSMIHDARRAGLQVMVGCFVESSLGIAAAAHLAPLARWADLDGAALLQEDPFGPAVVGPDGIHPPTRPGLGVDPV